MDGSEAVVRLDFVLGAESVGEGVLVLSGFEERPDGGGCAVERVVDEGVFDLGADTVSALLDGFVHGEGSVGCGCLDWFECN